MFLEFFSRELFSSLKKPMIYLFGLILALLVFGAVSSDNVQIGGQIGNVYKNAPTVITNFVLIMNVFGLLFATAFFNNAALRDHKYGFQEILFSTPLSKSGYFFGRFFGALLLSSFVMFGVYLGVILGTIIAPAVGWLEPDRLGPIRFDVFVKTYFIFVLPNMFVMGAIIYALASRFKSTVVSFIGTLFIIIGYIVAANMVSDLDSESIAAAVDIFGRTPYQVDIKYFTPQERNSIAPSLSNYVMINRLIWMAVGLVVLLISYFTFSFKTKNSRVKKTKNVDSTLAQTVFQKPSLSFNYGSSWATFVSFFKMNFRSMFRSNIFVILMAFAAIILVANLFGGFESFGLKEYPLTYKVLEQVNNLVMLFILIVMVFFSGELVWRDRDVHLNEVIDGTPHATSISLFAKALSLVIIGSILHLVLVFAGMTYQTLQGFTDYEFGLYVKDFFWNGFVKYIFWAALMVFIQVMINNKYVGYFVSVAVLFVWDFILIALDIESNMISLGGVPSIRYSDMNGFGPGMLGMKWFYLYWCVLAIVMLLLSGIFWPRGTNTTFKNRLKNGLSAAGPSYKGAVGFASVAWIAVAAFVYYNSQVLNPYKTSDEFEEMQEQYEKTYKKYENIQMPKVTDVTFHFDIFPEERNVDVKADYTIINDDSTALNNLHFTVDQDYDYNFEIPGATLDFEDKELGYRIFKLANSLQPGENLKLSISTKHITKGFENGAGSTSVVKNGTFFNNGDFLPTWGYAKGYEISDKNKRKKLGLPDRPRMPALESTCSETCMTNYLTNGLADWVNIETYISTSADQIAVAPGSLISEKNENGRNSYHYKVDQPSQLFASFISAKYEVARKKWNGIDIEVYYHKKHDYNIDKMLEAVQRSLEYYTENFGPYYHKQARILEFPRYASFAQAFPGTMPYSEGIGFIYDLRKEEDNTIVDAVIAHEMAHQYWAHQVIGAEMQGATMLSESFAEYSSLMVMKKYSSETQMADFLRYDMRRYLRGRSTESDKELPLAKVENQMHIHYGKGSIILYALQEYIGEDKVNNALRGFLEEYKYQDPPYPTTNDFMRYLEPEVPDSLQYLIEDWFESITLYDLRMVEATAEKQSDGNYAATVEVYGRKIKADSLGVETFFPIKGWVDVGFFNEQDSLIFKERVLQNQENQSFTFTLKEAPAKAMIDPLKILIDRVGKDNEKKIETKE